MPNKISNRLRDVLLWVMPLLALLPKYWLITHSLYRDGSSVFDTEFGFGDYIANLYRSGIFEACPPHLPFLTATADVCTHSSRMPVWPLLLTGLAKIVGTQAVNVAIAKIVVLAVLVSSLMASLGRDLRLTWTGLAILYAVYFGPQCLKHGATLEYEEGLLVDLMLCLAICVSYLLRPKQTASIRRRSTMAVIGVAIAATMYLTKTTTSPMLILMLGLVLCTHGISQITKLACAAIAIAAVAGWGWHNFSHSDQLHLSSSWNGENLLRGYNTGAYRIYPEIALDRIMDSREAVLANGVVVPLGDYRHLRAFTDEWAWNAYYHRMALDWLHHNPGTAFVFFLKKAWVTFFEIRHTPTYSSATSKAPLYPAAASFAMTAWMLIARLLMFLLVGRVLRDAIRRGCLRPLWVLAFILGACAPYVLVFAWERQIVPILVFAGAALVLLYHSPTIRRALPAHRQPSGAVGNPITPFDTVPPVPTLTEKPLQL